MANQLQCDFKMKTINTIIACLFVLSANAQSQFIQFGRVEYVKKINQFKPLEEQKDNPWMEEMMKQMPKIVTDIYELRFNNAKSVYKLAKENPDNKYIMWGGKPSATDGIVTDLQTQTISSQKDIFENTYLIKDSVQNLEWKISDETREIAGFECRKAVTKICDSVYVVAFYTDQIPVSTGPESFGGLPGLILGLADRKSVV